MKAFGTPVKIAALEFHSVFCERRCCVNVEQAARTCDQSRDRMREGPSVCWWRWGVWFGFGRWGVLEVRAPGTVPESYL